MIVRNLAKIKEQAASHEDQRFPGAYKKIIFKKEDFPKGLMPQMINWARIPAKKKFNLHYHQDMVEIFILTKGIVRMKVGSEKKILVSGESVLVPENTVHQMVNIGRSEVEYLIIGLSRGTGGKTIVV